ncbi:MAG: hypothetical protein J2P28_19010 [Actinobacteria bacterium]|nr:hypothetical protein [Actinomycetota bacterium]MBO0837581.1 hypothetical protein [Actinomycetota bacterium]
MIVPILVLAALAVGGLVIPFVVGLMSGPPTTPRSEPGDQMMRPLRRAADIYVGYFVFVIIGVAFGIKDGFYGGGSRGEACVQTGIPGPVGAGESDARPGTSLGGTAELRACIAHPTAGQWALYALTWLPGLVLWCIVLLMILRLVGHSARSGPFTPGVARLMARLGWLILAGCTVAGSLKSLGESVLTNMVTQNPFGGVPAVVANDLLAGSLKLLLPVPALAAVALLSFSRMTRAGAEMDEELQGTV